MSHEDADYLYNTGEDSHTQYLELVYDGLVNVTVFPRPDYSTVTLDTLRVMRAQAPTSLSLHNIFDRVARADIRINLWKFGSQLVPNTGQDVLEEGTPLRSFWPEKFIEPYRRKVTKTGITSELSFWWKIAPFELRIVSGQGHVADYQVRREVEKRMYVDSDLNTPVEGRERWIGQLFSEFQPRGRAKFVRIFRWNPFKKKR